MHTCTIRLVHAFTCAGILPLQYIKFCTFADIGNIGKWYIYKGISIIIHIVTFYYMYMHIIVYKTNGYLEVVQTAAELSMQHAVDEANHVMPGWGLLAAMSREQATGGSKVRM